MPVHSWLIAHGIRALIERRRREGAKLLFPEMFPSGDVQVLSKAYSRDFSKLKTKLGFGKRIVFHSFRITFRTRIAQSFWISDALLDAVTGHEGGVPVRLIDATTGTETQNRGTGSLYERPGEFDILVIRRVVEAFESPLDLEFIEPVAEAIEQAPSAKAKWAVNQAPARPARKPKLVARPKEKAGPVRKRVARVRRQPPRKA